MKLIHSNKEFQGVGEMLTQAREYEVEGKNKEAIAFYLKSLKLQPLNDKIYDRLLILYRKNKELKKEMALINKGIRTFETFYNKHHKKQPTKIARLSAALSKATGLADKKGKSLYAPEPLGRWLRRKAILEKKLS